eukprot:3856862-Pleurochrysis_carterae.AAC.5
MSTAIRDAIFFFFANLILTRVRRTLRRWKQGPFRCANERAEATHAARQQIKQAAKMTTNAQIGSVWPSCAVGALDELGGNSTARMDGEDDRFGAGGAP